MKDIKVLYKGTILETKFFLRNKEAFFFGLIFPLFLFILFGNLWESEETLKFLFTGIIGMTVSADAFFGVGPVIKNYRDYGILKLIKILPINPIYIFINVFISRILCSFISLFLLAIFSIFLFKMKFSIIELIIYSVGIAVGVLTFSFFSLSICLSYRSEGGRGLLNFLYFIMLFFKRNLLSFRNYALPTTNFCPFFSFDLSKLFFKR